MKKPMTKNDLALEMVRGNKKMQILQKLRTFGTLEEAREVSNFPSQTEDGKYSVIEFTVVEKSKKPLPAQTVQSATPAPSSQSASTP